MDTGVPSLILQAAQSAAQADGVASGDSTTQLMQQQILQQQHQVKSKQAVSAGVTTASTPTASGGKKKGLPLRRGKWTPEEEAYANRLIQEFKAGLLPLTDGTTLRTFLSKLLNCDPMRISKKFVGSNCIGKQVFRRRTADLNRLTPEQIQKSRAELSDLERRFLERVAQTNRVKSTGVGGTGVGAGTCSTTTPGPGSSSILERLKKEDFDIGGNVINNNTMMMMNPPSPPWLQPPLGYKQGDGAAMAAAAAANFGGNINSRAAAAGRALLEGFGSNNNNNNSRKNNSGMHQSQNNNNNNELLAMAELQRRASQQSLLQSMGGGGGSQNFFASQGSSMAQMARNASAARMAGLGGGGNSINNLMLKGLSRDELNQLARDGGLSSTSLSNMIERKGSFDALMGLNFQSLQSIDNLANLVQSGGGNGSWNMPAKNHNWSSEESRNNESLGSLSNATRRMASAGNMESLLRSLSNNNVKHGNGGMDNGGMSNANFQSLLQNMQNGTSMSSLLGGGNNNNNAASAASLANLLRENSSTGLTALRMQDGLNQRNSSVEDFLNLVADGYIPHQDPSLLSVPLIHHPQNGGHGGKNNSNNNGGGNPNNTSAAAIMAQQQLLAQATGNSQLANALASRSFGTMAQNASISFGNNSGGSAAAAAFLAQTSGDQGSSVSLKRRFLDLEGALEVQGSNNYSNKR